MLKSTCFHISIFEEVEAVKNFTLPSRNQKKLARLDLQELSRRSIHPEPQSRRLV